MGYGPGDMLGLTPKIACAPAYKKKNEKLKFLWSKDYKINTVHVDDVCKAIWHACTKLESGSIYNLADPSDFTAGKLNAILEKLFGVKTGFMGALLSRGAMIKLSATANFINNKHTPMWRECCAEKKILNTPIDTYIDTQ